MVGNKHVVLTLYKHQTPFDVIECHFLLLHKISVERMVVTKQIP